MRLSESGFYSISKQVDTDWKKTSRGMVSRIYSDRFVLSSLMTNSLIELSGQRAIKDVMLGFGDSLEAKKVVSLTLNRFDFTSNLYVGPIRGFSYAKRAGVWTMIDRCSDHPEIMIQFIFNRSPVIPGTIRVDTGVMVFG